MPRRATVVVGLLLCMMVLPLTGCNIIGGAAVALIPKAPVPAQYELVDKRTLVIVEDRRGMIQDPAVIRQVNASLREALEEKEVVTTGFVSQAELAALEGELGDAFRSTSLQQIGTRLDANQVIYAEIVAYQLQMGGGIYHPAMAMNVKVIDIDAGERVFPPVSDPETGMTLSSTSAPVRTELRVVNRTAEGAAAQSIASRELAAQAGLDVARLFFEWRRPEPGDMLRDDQP